MIEDKVIKAIEDNAMLCDCDNIAVGLSGGADSVCLTYILSKITDKNIIAMHLNHGLRGEEAERDMQFAKAFCDKLGIEFIYKKVNIKEIAEKEGSSEEECGRNERYKFFEEVASRYEKCRIATAHTLSDTAETVIFNMARGAGNKGICGIPAKRDNIIRPLIYCKREEIEEYLRENGIDFVTDSTNLQNDYTRNKIRNIVIPELKKINPRFEDAVLNLVSIAGEDEEYLEKAAKKAIFFAKEKDGYKLSYLKELHIAVLSRLIRDISPVCLSKQKIDIISEKIKSGNKKFKEEISGDLYAYAENGSFNISALPPEKENIPETPITPGKQITVCGKTVEYRINNLSANDALCRDKINESTLIIRSRRQGDKIKKGGHTKTLKKIYIEKKIPYYERNGMIVILSEGNIIFAEGIGVSDDYKADSLCKNKSEIIIKVGRINV